MTDTTLKERLDAAQADMRSSHSLSAMINARRDFLSILEQAYAKGELILKDSETFTRTELDEAIQGERDNYEGLKTDVDCLVYSALMRVHGLAELDTLEDNIKVNYPKQYEVFVRDLDRARGEVQS